MHNGINQIHMTHPSNVTNPHNIGPIALKYDPYSLSRHANYSKPAPSGNPRIVKEDPTHPQWYYMVKPPAANYLPSAPHPAVKPASPQNGQPYPLAYYYWQSTVMGLWNRIRDKTRVEEIWGLPEIGSPYPVMVCKTCDTTISIGYVRIVYGDHGPYIETVESQIKKENLAESSTVHYYYRELRCREKSCLKVYHQLQTVSGKPNPPPGAYSAYNNRPEGYADYRVGFYYFSPDGIYVKWPGNPEKAGDKTVVPQDQK